MSGSEPLSWSLSDGPPDDKHLDGKDKQRDTAPEHTPMPNNLPSDLREGDDPPDADVDWQVVDDPPNLDAPLDVETADREREAVREIAEAFRDYIEQGIEADPLAGSADRGGYLRGEQDGA